jgi:ubiquinone biosynthesis protein UbiJ
MNRAWLIRADQRIERLEAAFKATDIAAVLLEIEALKARLAALESKPKLGRPPKDKPE